MTYNVGNRVTSSAKGGVTTTYAYNNNGARTTVNGTATHTWDQINRLIRYVSGGVTTNYTYDGNGLRASKKVGTAATKMMHWDTASTLPRLLADGANKYLYGPGGRLIEQAPLTGTASAQYPLTDAAGTVHALTDNTGAVSARFTYNQPGKRLTATGTATTSFGFAGEYRDDESGYTYLRARYYDPNTAQFLSRDPATTATRDPYGYAAGDPINAGDPTGLFSNPFDGWGTEEWKGAAYAVAEGASYVAAATAFGALVVGTGGTAGVLLASAATISTYVGLGSGLTAAGLECYDGGPVGPCYSAQADLATSLATYGLGAYIAPSLRAKHLTFAGMLRAKSTYFYSNAAGGFTNAVRRADVVGPHPDRAMETCS